MCKEKVDFLKIQHGSRATDGHPSSFNRVQKKQKHFSNLRTFLMGALQASVKGFKTVYDIREKYEART
jgi:hypothetical protein